MNKYILELFKSKKEISEELENFKGKNTEIKQSKSGDIDLVQCESLANQIWEKIITKNNQLDFLLTLRISKKV